MKMKMKNKNKKKMYYHNGGTPKRATTSGIMSSAISRRRATTSRRRATMSRRRATIYSASIPLIFRTIFNFTCLSKSNKDDY